MIKFLVALLLPLFLSAAEPRFVQPDKRETNSILATVNGEPVSLYDVLAVTRNDEYKAYASLNGKELQQKILDIRRKAVDEIIDRKLVIADFKAESLEIKNRDIESEMDAAAIRMGVRSRSEFAARLAEHGSSLEKFRQELIDHMRFQLMLHRRFMIEVSVTPREMFEYYQQNQERFSQPATVDIAMILIKKENADFDSTVKLIAETLAAEPEKFSTLAEKFSDGPGRNDGGKLGIIEQKKLRPEYAVAIGGIPVSGKIYGPVSIPEGTAFLKIIAEKTAVNGSFDDSAETIRRELENAKRQQCRNKYITSLRKNAVIRYFFPEQ